MTAWPRVEELGESACPLSHRLSKQRPLEVHIQLFGAGRAANILTVRSDIGLSFVELARRQQILQAAIELLAEGGCAAATLSLIAVRIGASKGVISYHFDGKDELLAQVVAHVLADAGGFMSSRVTAVTGERVKLRAYVTANLEYLSAHRTEVRALNAVLTGLPPAADGTPVYAAAGRDAVEALAALLEAGQRCGEFRPFNARVAARSLRASIDAVTELLRAEPTLDIDDYADELLSLFEAAVHA